MQSIFELRGKTAIVTGASTGIGKAIAIALAEAGANVCAIGRSAPGETQKAIEKTGRRFQFIEADFASNPDFADIVGTVEGRFSHVDILVNNAGTIKRQDALSFSEKAWDEVLDVNLKSAFFLSQAAAHSMMKTSGRGRIINVASLLSFQGGIRVASYTASKSGLVGITRLLANEWAALGINVNAIAPGYVTTSNTTDLKNDPVRNTEIIRRIPAGRWGVPDDIAGAAVFLASRASEYIHGAVIPVDGGWMAR